MTDKRDLDSQQQHAWNSHKTLYLWTCVSCGIRYSRIEFLGQAIGVTYYGLTASSDRCNGMSNHMFCLTPICNFFFSKPKYVIRTLLTLSNKMICRLGVVNMARVTVEENKY